MSSHLLLLLCTIVLFSSRMFAQTSGAIVGAVQDVSGAAVVGATVSILDVSKRTTQVFKTDNSGEYSAPFLIPSTYSVLVEAPGFKRETSQHLVLEVDARQRADFTMQIGQTSEPWK